jgi:predicted HAD superfamily Cof-like phosphohydrolase
MQTNFEKAKQFNEEFGIAVTNTPDLKVFTSNPNLVDLRLKLIDEEVRELHEAVEAKDFVEVADALADILYVVYGAGASFGIDLDKAYRLVHESNMSKLCADEETAQKTVAWYEEQYAAGKLPYDSPHYRKSVDGTKWVVYNKSTGKVLKSIKYQPVDLKYLLD